MRIIDLHRNPPTPYLYVGRRMGGPEPHDQSPLGNPFKLRGQRPADVAAILTQYRAWLFDRIQAADRQILYLLREAITEETTLACWCCDKEGEAIFDGPEVCHAQVIAKAWRYLRSQANTT